MEKLSVIDAALNIWRPLLHRLWSGFWDWLPLLSHSLLYMVKHCPFVYSAYQFPLSVNFSLVRSWQMQSSLENQMVPIYWMYVFSIVNCNVRSSWPFCCVFIMILWQENSCIDAFMTLDRMQQISIKTKVRTIDSTCKMFQNWESKLSNPDREQMPSGPWTSALGSHVAFSLRQRRACSTLRISLAQVQGKLPAMAEAPPQLADKNI